jgi:hypothetical protein
MNEEEFGHLPIKMEEEEEEGYAPPIKRGKIGFIRTDDVDEENVKQAVIVNEAYSDFLRALAEERKTIIDNEKLNAKEKKGLLDENRKTLVVANGGSIRKTDSVVYGILIFGGIVLITLSLLTVFANLPHEITLAFVGTVLGGTIATIAQKLGKI